MSATIFALTWYDTFLSVRVFIVNKRATFDKLLLNDQRVREANVWKYAQHHVWSHVCLRIFCLSAWFL